MKLVNVKVGKRFFFGFDPQAGGFKIRDAHRVSPAAKLEAKLGVTPNGNQRLDSGGVALFQRVPVFLLLNERAPLADLPRGTPNAMVEQQPKDGLIRGIALRSY